MSKRHAAGSSAASDLSTAASIGQLLRAQFAIQNGVTEEKPKTVGFNEAENMRLYELYSAKREEYHSTRPSGQRNEEVPMDILAREWAADITSMGYAERTPPQIKQRIRDMRKFSRKHAHKMGLTNQGGVAGGTSNNNNNYQDPLIEFGWAETKRRSRGPVPDWMSGLAQIMMSEQDKTNDDSEVTSDVMEAAFGPKSKRLRLSKISMHSPTQQQSCDIPFQQLQRQIEAQAAAASMNRGTVSPVRDVVSRDMREFSPETALIEKKLALADAQLESEKLRQQVLRLEISYYQRQVQLYDEQLVANAPEITSTSSPAELIALKLNNLTNFKTEFD